MSKERLKKTASLSSLGLLALIASFSFPLNIRKQAGAERGWKCEKCGKSFSGGYCLECHHKTPEHDGGADDLENLIILCLLDHAEAHDELGDIDASRAIRSRHKNTNGGRTREWLKNNT